MRKKAKKAQLDPVPILWALLVVNVLLGLFFSKTTSIVHARTDGVKPLDKARIELILAKLKDIPCLRVDSKEVEYQVMLNPDVENAAFTRNIFGKALLVVQYRTPVAVIEHATTQALSVDGVLYESDELPADLPTLSLPEGGPPTLMAFAGNWRPQTLAALAVYARDRYRGIKTKIEIDPKGSVCLNIDSGRVGLGSCDNLDEKLKTLESRLRRNPGELGQVEELNLAVPSKPALLPKKGEKLK